MENFFSRYKNPLVLMAVLVVQVIVLATQVKRPDTSRAGGGPRLIRVWTVTAVSPLERVLVATGHFFRNTWYNYVDLHNVRRQNRELQQEIERMRLEQARLKNDAEQNRRLQALLDFKERYAGPTVAAQVIGSSGSEQSRVIYIDKGSHAGIRQDMAVITPDGIVGKVRDVYPFSSQVLMINDRDSGAGVILESSRLQGVLRGGKELGELRISDIMSDEKVDLGERVITSGGDRVYPKGLPVGTVTAVAPDPDASPFLAITLQPAADLSRLEEVLVVTKIAEEAPVAGDETPHRAADVLAQRLPSVPKKAEDQGKPDAAKAGPTPTGAVNKQTAPQKNNAAQATLKPVLKKREGDSTVKTGPIATSTVKKQAAPEKSSGAVPRQQTDQADPTRKKPAGAGVVKTGGAGPQVSPAATPTPTQPPTGDAEKPPR